MAVHFDPISGQFQQSLNSASHVHSLQECCRQVIKRASTIYRHPQSEVQILEMSDFCINADDLKSEHHVNQSYPATCLLDNKLVTLTVTDKECPAPASPSYITSFPSQEKTVHVFQTSPTLQELITKHKQQGTAFEAKFVWELVHYLASAVEDCDPTVTILKPENIFCYNDGTVFLDTTPQKTTLILTVAEDSPVYEPPEILMKQTADSRAFSWEIGCILYEMLALEAAYYNRAETPGGLFKTMMSIIQGEQPPVIKCSASFTNLIQKCFCPKDTRLSLTDILAMAKGQRAVAY